MASTQNPTIHDLRNTDSDAIRAVAEDEGVDKAN
jgi:hypothetical protein